jgi:hypothetical protein
MQCCGSVTFFHGSGSADPCHLSMDPNPDPAIFVIDLQDANKNCLLLFEGTFTSFSKIKSLKEVTNLRNQGLSYYFFLVKEGSGSISLTNGSGSRRPKNIQIQIRNTDCMGTL